MVLWHFLHLVCVKWKPLPICWNLTSNWLVMKLNPGWEVCNGQHVMLLLQLAEVRLKKFEALVFLALVSDISFSSIVWSFYHSLQLSNHFSAFIPVGFCSLEVQRSIPLLKKVYGESMRKVLHVGPDTCSVVSTLLKEDDSEAWGLEPYELEDVDSSCKTLVRKGFVRSADIKFPLPYGKKSFSLVIVSDALDYLSPKYLNKTLPDLARISADGLVIFSGN